MIYEKEKDEYDLNDIYMLKKDCELNNNYLEILKQCLVIRDIIETDKVAKYITYKYREYNDL